MANESPNAPIVDDAFTKKLFEFSDKYSELINTYLDKDDPKHNAQFVFYAVTNMALETCENLSRSSNGLYSVETYVNEMHKTICAWLTPEINPPEINPVA